MAQAITSLSRKIVGSFQFHSAEIVVALLQRLLEWTVVHGAFQHRLLYCTAICSVVLQGFADWLG